MLTTKSFYFIRHGETEHNAKGLCAGGKTDTPLNENGIVQSTSLRAILKTKKFGAVFSSPLKRAKITAYLATGETPQISFNLREWELGDFEETPVGPFLDYIQHLPFNVSLPNGESKSTFFKRSIEALNEILSLYKEPLIVAHGGTFWAILHMLKLPTELIKNAGCVYFDVKEDMLKIQMLEGK